MDRSEFGAFRMLLPSSKHLSRPVCFSCWQPIVTVRLDVLCCSRLLPSESPAACCSPAPFLDYVACLLILNLRRTLKAGFCLGSSLDARAFSLTIPSTATPAGGKSAAVGGSRSFPHSGVPAGIDAAGSGSGPPPSRKDKGARSGFEDGGQRRWRRRQQQQQQHASGRPWSDAGHRRRPGHFGWPSQGRGQVPGWRSLEQLSSPRTAQEADFQVWFGSIYNDRPPIGGRHFCRQEPVVVGLQPRQRREQQRRRRRRRRRRNRGGR